MVLKEDKEFAINGKQKSSVREETSSFGHDGDARAKPTPQTAPPSEPPIYRGRSASRKKNLRGRSPSRKFDRQPCKKILEGICTKSLCDCWHLPNVNSIRVNRVVNSAISARLHTGRLRDNPAKKPKKYGDKSAVAFLKDVRQFVAYFRTQSRRKLNRFYGRAQRSGDQFDEYDSQKLRSVMQTSEKTNVRRSEKQVKTPHQRSPYALKLEDRYQEEIERQERCARGDARRLAKNILKLKETETAAFFSLSDEWILPAPPTI